MDARKIKKLEDSMEHESQRRCHYEGAAKMREDIITWLKAESEWYEQKSKEMSIPAMKVAFELRAKHMLDNAAHIGGMPPPVYKEN